MWQPYFMHCYHCKRPIVVEVNIEDHRGFDVTAVTCSDCFDKTKENIYRNDLFTAVQFHQLLGFVLQWMDMAKAEWHGAPARLNFEQLKESLVKLSDKERQEIYRLLNTFFKCRM